MSREKLRKTKKDKLVLLARKSNVRNASLMNKERLVQVLMGLNSKKTKARKSVKAKAKVRKVVKRISQIPQHTVIKKKPQPSPGAVIASRTILPKSEQLKIEETKYYLGPQTGYRRQEEFQFPAVYGDNKIVAMVRDPWWLYSYWEIAPERERQVLGKISRKGLKAVRTVLRVYDVTGIESTLNEKSAHIFFDIELKDFANTWYVNVGTPNRSWIIDIGIVANTNEFFLLARSNCVKTPRFGMSEVIDEEWMCQEDEYWKMFGLSGGFDFGKASLSLKKMFKKRLLEQVSSGSISSWSSPMKSKEARKNFWLKVNTELIVYGQTEANAHVTVQGKKLRLRKDGSFTVRFALPDGRQEIPVSATSFDRDDTRTITPIVKRRTE